MNFIRAFELLDSLRGAFSVSFGACTTILRAITKIPAIRLQRRKATSPARLLTCLAILSIARNPATTVPELGVGLKGSAGPNGDDAVDRKICRHPRQLWSDQARLVLAWRHTRLYFNLS